MDRDEAKSVLAAEVARLRTLSYAELSARVPRRRRRLLGIEFVSEDQDTTREVVRDSGAVYQVQTQVVWDHRPGRDVRVIVAVDDGGPSAIRPLTDDFILSPDGSFVGE